jgi:RNA polymerase sigma-70 factor, ECF subfamily
MDSTRVSLLSHASAGCDQAWSQMVQLYQPLVYGWLRRHEVSHHDAEDLTQDVLSVLVRELPSFVHSGRTGAFRCWLRQITAHRAQQFWRPGRRHSVAAGPRTFVQMAELLADDASDLSRRWDRGARPARTANAPEQDGIGIRNRDAAGVSQTGVRRRRRR